MLARRCPSRLSSSSSDRAVSWPASAGRCSSTRRPRAATASAATGDAVSQRPDRSSTPTRRPSGVVTGTDQHTQSCTDSHQCSAENTVAGSPVSSASPRALVPAEGSSQRPPSRKPTPSAISRICLPPTLHRMRPSSSVMAAIMSAASAARPSCSSTPTPLRRIGDASHLARTSSGSQSTGAAARWLSSSCRHRSHDSLMAGSAATPEARADSIDRRRLRSSSLAIGQLLCGRAPVP